jgi:hypothetical protein
MTDPKDTTDAPVDEELSIEALDAVAGGAATSGYRDANGNLRNYTII